MTAEEPKEDKDEERPTQATKLINIGRRAQLIHTQDGDGYAVVSIESHLETWPIRSRGFKRWLLKKFYEQEGKAPGGQAIQDAIGTLEAQAHLDGPAIIEEHGATTLVEPAQQLQVDEHGILIIQLTTEENYYG